MEDKFILTTDDLTKQEIAKVFDKLSQQNSIILGVGN